MLVEINSEFLFSSHTFFMSEPEIREQNVNFWGWEYEARKWKIYAVSS